MKFAAPLALAAYALIFAPVAALADARVPSPPRRQLPPTPIDNLAHTAQGRLEAVSLSLNNALAALARDSGSEGPQLDQAVADITAAKALVIEALAWLHTHPEANNLPPGPAPAETSAIRPITIPQDQSKVPRLNHLVAVEALNTALGNLLNNPDPAAKTPVLGALVGHRVKIMAAIGRANDDMLALIRSTATPAPAQRGSRAGAPSTRPSSAVPAR